MGELRGIGKKSRLNLGKVLYQCRGIIRASEVARILNISIEKSFRLLRYWEKNGWIYRIKKGEYLPIPIESDSAQIAIEDPFKLATELFSPCYIGGWSAAEYWNLTEQIFQTFIVFTEKHFSSKVQKISNTKFLLKMVKKNSLFGYESEWREGLKVSISNPTKTIVDIFDDPLVGGGIRSVCDFYEEYLKSEYFSEDKLINYTSKLGNRTVFKRMGFITEKVRPSLSNLILYCQSRISKGYSQLDPSMKSKNIITKWKLRIPKGF